MPGREGGETSVPESDFRVRGYGKPNPRRRGYDRANREIGDGQSLARQPRPSVQRPVEHGGEAREVLLPASNERGVRRSQTQHGLGGLFECDHAPRFRIPVSPEARYEQTESISLAFVTALQILPPRQLVVLILRDVLGFHANEVGGMLDTTVESVKSALKRARAGMQRRLPVTTAMEPPPGSASPAEDAIFAKFVSAYESADIDALVALLTGDVFLSMPPMPLEYQGRDSVARFFAFIFGSVQGFHLVRTRANGQPAFGVYRQTSTGIHGVGLFVLTLSGNRISAMTRFEDTVLPIFGLPQSLPSTQ